MHAALTQAGATVELQQFPRRWHVFQANVGLLADADRALEPAAPFLRRAWPA